MRITQSMYYNNLFSPNKNKLSKSLYDVNKQISSGLKIEYAKDDVSVFDNTMRLDNEITTLQQVTSSTDSAIKFSTQTDTTLNDFQTTLDRIKVLLTNAANASHDEDSLYAISEELKGLRDHLKNLSNTSVNGKYLFSGSALNTKPIDENGNYHGNDEELKAFGGSKVQIAYNIPGSDLFLGEESQRQRNITSNVKNINLTKLYPDLTQDSSIPRNMGEEKYLSIDDTIADLMGSDVNDDIDEGDSYFYIRGKRSDGTTFKAKYQMSDDETIANLLDKIKEEYGGNVDVTLNAHGEIEVRDRQKGSSLLDFHMIAAKDYSGNNDADVDDIDDLDSGTTDFVDAAENDKLFVKEFLKSNMQKTAGAASNIDGIVYDRTQFDKEGFKVTSNISQISKLDNSYATDSTLLKDVFSSVENGTLRLEGKDANGNDYAVNLVFGADANNDPVKVEVLDSDGNVTDSYNVADGRGNDTVANDMTYRQLLDVINMAITHQIPQDNNDDYRAKIDAANELSSVDLTFDGKIQYKDKTTANKETKTTIALYDLSTNDFSTTNGVLQTFQANNALTITDPKTNFFHQLDEAIQAVSLNRLRPDGNNSDAPRNVGIQNGIQIIDDLSQHVTKLHAKIGAKTNALEDTKQRSELLTVSTKALRSSFIDTDIAEASLQLNQLNLNYQAMLSTIARVSKLSLVNYL